ncbi:hypothetical protein MRX96_056150 [Rhipicephalus microplus]
MTLASQKDTCYHPLTDVRAATEFNIGSFARYPCRCFKKRPAVGPTLCGVREQPLLHVRCARQRTDARTASESQHRVRRAFKTPRATSVNDRLPLSSRTAGKMNVLRHAVDDRHRASSLHAICRWLAAGP